MTDRPARALGSSVKLFVLTALVALASSPSPRGGAPRAESPTTGAVATERWGRLPLRFEANAGQLDEGVRFLARASGATVFLGDEGATLGLRAASGAPHASQTAITLRVEGGRVVTPVPGEPLVTKTNYFLGDDPARWRTGVANYARVTYPSVLDGVDLVFHGDGRRLEYDLVVAPGVDAGRIAVDVGGADGLSLTADGDLAIQTPNGTIVQARPRVYQLDGDRRAEVRGAYRIVGRARVGFEVAEYDRARPLVIDPTLDHSSYLGGSGDDRAYGLAADATGVYVAGFTNSPNFPIDAPVAGDTSLNLGKPTGADDAFVAKLDPTLQNASYVTYLGGSQTDEALSLGIDAAGDAYVAGWTFSLDFPKVNALVKFNGNSPSNPTGFVAELSPSGNQLVYSTYLGGGNSFGPEQATAIAVDAAGHAFVTGQTGSAAFPVANAFQPKPAPGSLGSAFVSELAVGGGSFVFSTYLGGNSSTQGYGIALDANGDAVVVGATSSTDFPTQAPLQGALAGANDAFITAFAPGGASLVFSTYLGGSADDGVNSAIAVDAAGNVYATGNTSSADFPTTPGAYAGGKYGSFTAKLSAGGSSLAYSVNGVGGTAIAVDASGEAFVDQYCAGVAVLSADGSTLLPNQPYSVVPGASCPGPFVVQGLTFYGSGYTTGGLANVAGSYQPSFGGGTDDAFVVVVTMDGGASPLAIAPIKPSTAPLGKIAFNASGGSGSGYTFGFPAGGNHSGGTLSSGPTLKSPDGEKAHNPQ